jgi:transcriptional accessory protein Tex/SPT6
MAQPAVDDATILALTEAGKPSREIEAITGIGYRTVCRRLKDLTPRKTTEIYKSYRADIFAEMQRKIIASCHATEIKKMATRDKFMAMGILFDKEMIVRGVIDNNTRPMVVIQVKGDATVAVDNSADKAVINHNP